MGWKHPIHVAVVRAAGIAINFLLPAIPSPPQQRLSEEILTLYMKGCSLFSVAPFLILQLGMRPISSFGLNTRTLDHGYLGFKARMGHLNGASLSPCNLSLAPSAVAAK